MTSEEIKQTVTMPELMKSNGIHIRNNMCSCPFHGHDRHPSMKVFKDGATCFTCGWNGDVFKFVMDYNHVDFRTAYTSLGGTYARHENERARVQSKARLLAEKQARERKRLNDKRAFAALNDSIRICQAVIDEYGPYTDEWCSAQNRLHYLIALQDEYLQKQEIDTDVFRVHREIRQQFLQ